MLARSGARQGAAVFVGLVNVIAAPTFLALANLAGKSGDALLEGAVDPRLSPGERAESPLFHLSYLVGTSLVLVALGVVFARGAERKAPYRALEVAGLLAFLSVLTLLSLARTQDWLYPSVLLLGSLAALAAGAWQRHLLLVLLPSLALVPNLWVQYFAKLSGTVPLGLLLLGFGIGVLVGAIAFERKVRPLLREVRAWA